MYKCTKDRRRTEKRIHSLCVGWRNLFLISSCPDSQIRQNSNLRVRTWNPVQPLNFPLSAFCGRCLLWTSVGRNYDSYRWPYDCTFFFQVLIIFVLVLVQIDLIHFEHTKCISSTSIKTNAYPLHLRSIHTISCKIGHVIQIVPD